MGKLTLLTFVLAFAMSFVMISSNSFAYYKTLIFRDTFDDLNWFKYCCQSKTNCGYDGYCYGNVNANTSAGKVYLYRGAGQYVGISKSFDYNPENYTIMIYGLGTFSSSDIIAVDIVGSNETGNVLWMTLLFDRSTNKLKYTFSDGTDLRSPSRLLYMFYDPPYPYLMSKGLNLNSGEHIINITIVKYIEPYKRQLFIKIGDTVVESGLAFNQIPGELISITIASLNPSITGNIYASEIEIYELTTEPPPPPPPQPRRVSITKSCEKNSTVGGAECRIPDINIPTYATNITTKTMAYILPYGYLAVDKPEKTFEITACNPYANILDPTDKRLKCKIQQNPCTMVGWITPVIKYNNNYYPGQTVSSNVEVDISVGSPGSGACLEGGSGSYYKLVGITTVEYDIINITEKYATLSASPTSGDITTLFNFYLTTSNLAKPYWVYWYVGDMLVAYERKYEDTASHSLVFGPEKTGYQTITASIVDAENWRRNVSTQVYVSPTAGIQSFTFTVTPTQGNVFDFFTFETTEIKGGTPPYKVIVKLNGTVELERCYNIPENGRCVKAYRIPCGTWIMTARAEDSEGRLKPADGFKQITVTCAPMGETLTASLMMKPTTGDFNTIFNFTLSISGGAPPYYVSWRRFGTPICSGEVYHKTPPFNITHRFKFWSGSHSIDVGVRSADGQEVVSNQLNFEVGWSSKGKPAFVSYDCIGNLGEGWTMAEEPVPFVPEIPSGYEKPIINETSLIGTGAGWLSPFFTPFFLSTLMLLGISGFITLSVSKYGGDLKTSGGVFLGCLILLSLVYAVMGIYPSWLVIIFIIIAGLIFAKFIIGLI